MTSKMTKSHAVDDKIIAVCFFLFHFSVYVSKIPKGAQIFIFRDFACFYI